METGSPGCKDWKTIWRYSELTKLTPCLHSNCQDYKNPKYAADQKGRAVECGDQGQIPPGESSVCMINQDSLFNGLCKNESAYGFNVGKPCILIKLNKIFNWKPVPYADISEMPENIPQSIKDAFKNNIKEGKEELVSSNSEF